MCGMLIIVRVSDSRTASSENRTDTLLTVSDVAGWLGIAEGTLRYWRHVHRGPRSLSVGGAVRYRVRDIEQWLERSAEPGE